MGQGRENCRALGGLPYIILGQITTFVARRPVFVDLYVRSFFLMIKVIICYKINIKLTYNYLFIKHMCNSNLKFFFKLLINLLVSTTYVFRFTRLQPKVVVQFWLHRAMVPE